MANQKIERVSFTAQVAGALRDEISSGYYHQGDELRQDIIAKRMGVSRLPVREALQQLESEGLVEYVPYKGAIVSGLTTDEIREYHEIRRELEAYLITKALPNIGDADCDQALSILKKWRSADPDELAELNWDFHRTLYEPAGCPLTIEILAGVHNRIRRYVRLQLSLSDYNRIRAAEEHENLVKLARAKDKKIIRETKIHIDTGCDDLIEFLDNHES